MLPRAATGVFLVLLAAPLAAAEKPASGEGAHFFQTQVQPILQAHCLRCHGGKKPRGGLSLTSRAALLAGGERGPAVSTTRPAESLLLAAVTYKGLKMPPTGKLAKAQIDVLDRW